MQRFLEKTARRFFNIDSWLGAKPVGDGNINDTYRIDFQQGGVCRAYLLQRLNHTVFRDPAAVMRNWQAVAEHLAGSDYPYRIPAPVPTSEGGACLLVADDCPQFPDISYWRVFPFFEGTFAPETVRSASAAFEAARAYGAFLRALEGFPVATLTETIPGFHDTDRRWTQFLDILEKDPANRCRSAAPEIEAMFKAEPIFEKISQLKRSGELPLRVTHNDTKAGNVLLDKNTGQAVAVIDWDTVMPGCVLSDFGDMMRSFAPDRNESDPDADALHLRPDIVRALCRGFLLETRHFLTKTERESLFLGGQWIIGEQVLRFLADYLAGDPYYKIAYPEHNLVRTRNQLALLARVSEAEDEITGYILQG